MQKVCSLSVKTGFVAYLCWGLSSTQGQMKNFGNSGLDKTLLDWLHIWDASFYGIRRFLDIRTPALLIYPSSLYIWTWM